MSAHSAIVADQNVLNAQIFHQNLDRLMGASIGVIAVRTREMERAKMLLHEWASMRGMDFHVWDRLKGFRKYKSIPTVQTDNGKTSSLAVDEEIVADFLQPQEEIPNTISLYDAMSIYDRRAHSGDSKRNKFLGVFFGVDETELEMPPAHQFIRDHVTRSYECDDRMIMLLPVGVEIPSVIQGDVEVLDLDPPSFAELKETFDDLRDTVKEALGYEATKDDADAIVQNGLGMTNQEFENSISLAIVDIADKLRQDDDAEVTADDFIEIIRQRKLEILKQTQMLELMASIDISKVGGLDLLKADLARVAKAFSPEAREFGVTLPKGIVLVGPPGTGKTLLCKVCGSVLGMPSIRFDMSAVYQGLVGSSEQNMRTSLKMVDDMAPCILFIDEIEKSVASDGGNDGGVSSRVLGIFLTWLNDRADTGTPVYVVASANDVSKMPPELLRMGRFDDKWAISFPSKKEREDILRIHVQQRGHKLTKEQYAIIAASTETFVGAELEGIVEKALREDFFKGNDKLEFETLKHFALTTKPQIKAFPERIRFLADWAEKNARPASSVQTFETPAEGGSPVRPIRRRPKPRTLRSSNN